MRSSKSSWTVLAIVVVLLAAWLPNAAPAQTAQDYEPWLSPPPEPTPTYPPPYPPPPDPPQEPLPPPDPIPGDEVRICFKNVHQWEPGLSELAALEPTWSGTFELQGSPSWSLSIDLGPDACRVAVAPSIDHEIPYQQYLDWDGTLSSSGVLDLSIFEPGVYAVTAYYQDAATPPRTYMIWAGAKKSNVVCGPNVI